MAKTIFRSLAGILASGLLFIYCPGARAADHTSAMWGPQRISPPPVFDTELLPGKTAQEETGNRNPQIAKVPDSERFSSSGSENNDKNSLTDAMVGDISRQLGKGFSVIPCGSFIVASDIDREVLDGRLFKTLKLCQEALKRDYFSRHPETPVVIYAFSDRTSYHYNLRRLWNEVPISPYGHYNYTRKQVVFNGATGFGTMIHESVHALMDSDMPLAPIWIAEGIATLYEQCLVADGSLKGTLNWRLPELQRKLYTEKCTPLSELVRMTDNQFKQRESLNYAIARFFCMYMEEHGLLRPMYRDYRDHFQRDPTGRIFIEQAFDKPLEKIEAEWKDWVRQLDYVTPSNNG